QNRSFVRYAPCLTTRSGEEENKAKVAVSHRVVAEYRQRSQLFLAIQKVSQRLGTGGMAQLSQGLGLDLADALARDFELLSDLLQRVVGVHLDAEAHAKHLRLARRQRAEHVLGDPA